MLDARIAMIASATLAAALAVLGPSAEAREAYERAVTAWEAEDWPAAADAFAKAFELDPRRELLWSQAQALRFAGDCKHAIEVYERFIAMDPPDVDRETARGNIERCELEVEPEPEPAPPPPVVVEPAPPEQDRPPPRQWYADPTGMTLFVSGLAIAAVGAGLVGSAHVTEANADDGESEQTYRRDIATAQRFNAGGIACLAVGGALLVGGTIRFIIVSRRARRAMASSNGFGLRF